MRLAWEYVRLGVRRSLQAPKPTLVAVAALALGIGVTASALSVIRAVLVRPLPYEDPNRLVLVTSLEKNEEREDWPVSYPDFLDWRARSRSFSQLAAFTRELSLKSQGPEGPELIAGEMVSASYFRTLGLQPAVGRAFSPGEDREPGAAAVAVLSHELWRRRFQADPSAVGSKLDLDEHPYVIIGVMPDGFRGLTDRAQVWIPISMATRIHPRNLESRRYRWLSVVGRLSPGQTVDAARRDLDRVAHDLEREHGDTNQDIGVSLETLSHSWFGDLRPVLLLILGGSVLVLLVAFSNVSNLWLVQVAARQREVGIRLALGADRGRVTLQLLTEALLLALAGCLVGLLIAGAGTRKLVAMSGAPFRSFVDVAVDPWVVLSVLGVTLVLAVLFGSLAGTLTVRQLPGSLLQDEGQNATRSRAGMRLQSLLVVHEVALTMLLLVAASVMIQDFQRLTRMNLGFQPGRLLTVRASIQGSELASDTVLQTLIVEARERLGALPGVESVALAGPAIPTDSSHGFTVILEDQASSDEGTLVLRHHVSPGYFETLGIALRQGRLLRSTDDSRSLPVVVVSESLARRAWPGENPLGKRLKLGPRDAERPWLAVVGVVGDVKHEGWGQEQRPAPDLYLPVLQSAARNPPVLNLLLRTSIVPETVVPGVLREMRRLAPGVPLYDVKTMEERMKAQTTQKRFFTGLVAGSALLATFLALIGIFNLISHSVSQRVRELGIRMALGATTRDLAVLLLGRGIRLGLAGVVLGGIAAAALGRVAERFGFGSPDPGLFGGTSILLVILVVAASYMPIRRVLKKPLFRALNRAL
jgi:putative ABC transport system permease protein